MSASASRTVLKWSLLLEKSSTFLTMISFSLFILFQNRSHRIIGILCTHPNDGCTTTYGTDTSHFLGSKDIVPFSFDSSFTSFLNAVEAPLFTPCLTSERDRFFNPLLTPIFTSLKKLLSHNTSYLRWKIPWYTWTQKRGWSTPTKNTTPRLISSCWRSSIHFEKF